MFHYIYCLVIALFNGQLRFSENLSYEKKFAKKYFRRESTMASMQLSSV